MASETNGKTYIVEHLDPELGPWSELEYICIGQDSQKAGSRFLLSSLPDEFRVPDRLAKLESFTPEKRSVEEMYPPPQAQSGAASEIKNQVCLLDPAAKQDLSPEDGKNFGVFLFGGILGKSWSCGFVCRFAVVVWELRAPLRSRCVSYR